MKASTQQHRYNVERANAIRFLIEYRDDLQHELFERENQLIGVEKAIAIFDEIYTSEPRVQK